MSDELPVDEGLAVVVNPHVGDAELGALVDDFAEQVELHDALAPMHLVAGAEDALRVADVGALDLDDLRQAWRAVAAGCDEQTAQWLGLLQQHRLCGATRPSPHGER